MTDEVPAECCVDGCFGVPTHDVFFVFRSRRHNRAVASLPAGVAVCASCKETAELSDFLDDETWETIRRGFDERGRVPPDRDATMLDLQPISRKDW